MHPALRWSWYAAALLSTVLAMKTKETFTLPIMLTVLEFFFFSGTVRQRLRFLAPFLLTLVIIPMATYDLLAESGRRVGELTVPAGRCPGRHISSRRSASS